MYEESDGACAEACVVGFEVLLFGTKEKMELSLGHDLLIEGTFKLGKPMPMPMDNSTYGGKELDSYVLHEGSR